MAQGALNQQIQVGDKAPLWSAQSHHGEVNLNDYLGEYAILLVFYSADWSDICSDELPLIDEMIKFAGDIKLKTFGISKDSISSHKAFARQVGLDHIILISDPDNVISSAYGMLNENNQCKRATILVDYSGTVHWIRIEPKRNQPRPLDEIEKVLQFVREWNGYPTDISFWRNTRHNIMQLKRQKPLPIPTRLDLHFWGTRGSIPVSGIEYQRYGGNTSCVSLTSDTGHLFIFDCGSGIRELGNFLLSNQWNPPTEDGQKIIAGYIFLSHTHWDHIQGFPFFNPVFRPHNRFNLMGWSNCSQTLMSIMAGQMEQIYFPVSLKSLPSELNFFSIQYGFAQLDGAQLSCKLLKHPLPSAAYRLELAGKVVVYATDHEPHDIPVIEQGKMLDENIIDPKLVELARDADVLIHDAQYSTLQLAHKRGWGHSSSEIAVDTAIKAGVKKLILFHHDPSHDDDTIDSLLEAAHHRKRSLGNSSLEILSAYDGMYLEV